MKIVTFKRSKGGGDYRIGSMISESEIVDLTNLIAEGDLSTVEILSCFDLANGFFDRAKSASGEVVSRNDVKICAPVPRPGKIICIGLNYRDHAAESGMPIPNSPVIFSKFSTCAMASEQPIVVPNGSCETDY